jgi:hypothetical protein
MRGTIKFAAGEHKLTAPLHVGSMRVMGRGNAIMFSAFPTFYNKLRNLLVVHIFQKFSFAASASVSQGSAALDDRPDKAGGENRSF